MLGWIFLLGVVLFIGSFALLPRTQSMTPGFKERFGYFLAVIMCWVGVIIMLVALYLRVFLK
jgi:hypothetical protein